MAKKLTAELELETEKAKQKVKSLEGVTMGGGGSSAATDRLAQSAEKAAKATGSLGEAARETSSRMNVAVKMFGGMAVRMATSYAASQMGEGAGATAVKAAGTVASGALMGSALGPAGAAAGAALGAVQAGIDIAGERERKANDIANALAGFEESERAFQSLKNFKAMIDGFTDTSNSAASRLAKIDEELNTLKAREVEFVGKVKDFIQEGELETAGKQQGYLNGVRQRISSLEAVREQVAGEEKPMQTQRERGSFAANDALTRFGAGFTSGGGEALTVAKDQLKELKDIKTNLQNQKGVWA